MKRRPISMLILVLSWSVLAASPEQAVIIHFTYGSTDLSRLFSLEDQIERAVEGAGVGDYDGNEVAEDGSDGYLYLYGRDADALYKLIRPILSGPTSWAARRPNSDTVRRILECERSK